MQNASRPGNRLFSSQFKHSKGDRQIKTGPFLPYICRRKIDRDPLSTWPAQRAIANGRGDPIFALFDGGVWQSDYSDFIRVVSSRMNFDLHLKRLDAHDRGRINL